MATSKGNGSIANCQCFAYAFLFCHLDVIQMMEDKGEFQVDTSRYVDMLKEPLQ